MTNTGTEQQDGGTQRPERDGGKPNLGGDHPFKVTVRGLPATAGRTPSSRPTRARR